MNENSHSIYRAKFRVYYEDTDAGGVVYHANYLNFFERVRTDWLRSCGIVQSRLAAQHDLKFAIHSMHIEYISPARLDDLITVSCQPVTFRNASMDIAQSMHVDERLLARAQVRAVCIRASDFKPVKFPHHLKQEIMR